MTHNWPVRLITLALISLCISLTGFGILSHTGRHLGLIIPFCIVSGVYWICMAIMLWQMVHDVWTCDVLSTPLWCVLGWVIIVLLSGHLLLASTWLIDPISQWSVATNVELTDVDHPGR